MEINTESGLWIESVALSSQLASHIDQMMSSDNSWQVNLSSLLVRRRRGRQTTKVTRKGERPHQESGRDFSP